MCGQVKILTSLLRLCRAYNIPLLMRALNFFFFTSTPRASTVACVQPPVHLKKYRGGLCKIKANEQLKKVSPLISHNIAVRQN